VFEGEGFGMVDPGWRGRGIGGWLVRRVEELAGDGSALAVSAPASDRAYRELVGVNLAQSGPFGGYVAQLAGPDARALLGGR
jgi:GNAT superfamily N-acetyltransferase